MTTSSSIRKTTSSLIRDSCMFLIFMLKFKAFVPRTPVNLHCAIKSTLKTFLVSNSLNKYNFSGFSMFLYKERTENIIHDFDCSVLEVTVALYFFHFFVYRPLSVKPFDKFQFLCKPPQYRTKKMQN